MQHRHQKNKQQNKQKKNLQTKQKNKGRDKNECYKEYGKEQIQKWRRGYKDPPPPLTKDNKYHPSHDLKYNKLGLSENDIPSTESLYHVVQRIKPIWQNHILPNLKKQQNLLFVCHGTSCRALVSLVQPELKGEKVIQFFLFISLQNSNKR